MVYTMSIRRGSESTRDISKIKETKLKKTPHVILKCKNIDSLHKLPLTEKTSFSVRCQNNEIQVGSLSCMEEKERLSLCRFCAE